MTNEITLFLADDEQARSYVQRGKDWGEQAGIMFGDVKRTVSMVVAEYLANRDGFTIYECMVGQKYRL